jgi:hypothetical protein
LDLAYQLVRKKATTTIAYVCWKQPLEEGGRWENLLSLGPGYLLYPGE